MARPSFWKILTLPIALVGSGPAGLAGQEDHALPTHLPTHEFVVAGYGTAGWRAVGEGGANSFFGSVSPLLLFQFGDRVLFEAELEFEIEDGVTRTGLEYAQVDFFLDDNLTLVAGKFLVPFGVFGERLHPTWINRFATNPPIYGHGGGSLQPLLPILADFGAMVRGAWAFGGGRSLIASAYVTQGPFVEGGHGEEEPTDMEPMAPSVPRLEFAFGEQTTDLTDNKMIGGRIGWVVAPSFEVDISGLTGAFDEEGSRLNGLNVAAELRRGGFEFRGEAVGLWYDVEMDAEAGEPEPPGEEHGERLRARTGGYYIQAARRFGAWEPTLRWTQAFEASAEGLSSTAGYRQLGLGLDYWIAPAIAIMAAYERNSVNGDAPDRFLVHWSFGF